MNNDKRNQVFSQFALLLGLILPFSTSKSIMWGGSFYGIARSGLVIDLYTIIIIYFLFLLISHRISFHLVYSRFMVLFLVYVFINTFFISPNSFISLGFLCRFFTVTLAYVIILNFTEENVVSFLKGARLSLIFELLLGFYQLGTGKLLGLGFLGERALRSDIGSVIEKGISGTLEHPGIYSIYLLCLINLMIILHFKKHSSLNILLIGLAIVQIVATFSRTSIAILLFYVFVMVYFYFLKGPLSIKKMFYAHIFILCVIIFAFFGYKPLLERFFHSDFTAQINNRIEYWKSAFNIIKLKPFLGHGGNMYLIALQRYSYMVDDPYTQTMVHNGFLLVWAELGCLGLLFYLWGFFRCLKNLRKYFSSYDFRFLSLSLLTILIYNFQGWGALRPQMYYITFIVIALMHRLVKNTGIRGKEISI